MSFVKVSNLFVKYGNLTAVQNLSFEIPPGEVFGFIGPNGAGKSSTIRVMATLQSPAAGSVHVDGLDVSREPRAVRRIIGYMPDAFGVYDDLSVKQYLHFFAAAYDLPRGERPKTVDTVLALTDLTGKKDAQVDTLSRLVSRQVFDGPSGILVDQELGSDLDEFLRPTKVTYLDASTTITVRQGCCNLA
jgi:ABC-2 type transport system ATP-binding protein